MRSYSFPNLCCGCGSKSPGPSMTVSRKVGRMVYSIDVPVCKDCKAGYRRRQVLAGLAGGAAALVLFAALCVLAGQLGEDSPLRPISFIVGLLGSLGILAFALSRFVVVPPARFVARFSWGQPPPPTLAFRSEEF